MEKLELVDRENKEIITSQLLIKKSKFIAKIYYINTKEQAEEIIEKNKQEHKNAKHIVYAYMLKSGGKFTDDKEPQGTAGKPLYSLLEQAHVINVLIIVIRYFGGILLGTGPLTRAYSLVAKQALDKCNKKTYVEYEEKTIICEYKDEENIKRQLQKEESVIQDIKHNEKVEISYLKIK